MKIGNKKYEMDNRIRTLDTIHGEYGWWTEIAIANSFSHAREILMNESKHNNWKRIVIINNIVYGLNRPFVYQKVIEYDNS